MTHSTPIGVVFKSHNITYQIVGTPVNLNEILRKDLAEKEKPYFKLRALFTCESCGELTERNVLNIYEKLIKENTPYVICDSCLHQRSALRSRLLANNRWREKGFVRLVDKLEDLNEYWNHEKNPINLEGILLKEVNNKDGAYHYSTFYLYCYLCEGECERSLRTVLNNHSNTGHSWVLCDKCKSEARTSKSEILYLLISEYCSKNFGLSFEFQHRRENLFSKNGNPLAFDFAFYTSEETLSFILEIQGGLHSEKHFSESDEDFLERIERDVIKRDYCQEHCLELIEIDYHFPSKKELRRMQSIFIELLTDHGLIPNDVDIPDFSEFAFYITLEYQKLNTNYLTIKKLVTYVIEGKRIDDLTDIELIRKLFLSDKKTKTAYNRVILPEVINLLKNTNNSIMGISKITKMSQSAIRRVNNGETYSEHTHASKEKPLKKMKRARIDEETILGIVMDLKETDLTFRDIAKKRKVSESVTKSINDGSRYTQFSGASKEHPIRPSVQIGKEMVLAIMNLLKNTTWTQKKIAENLGITEAIVQKINTGYNHSNITYASSKEPIRKRKKEVNVL